MCKSMVGLNSVTGSLLGAGFLVLLIFCTKEKGLLLETRIDDKKMFLHLRANWSWDILPYHGNT